MITRRNMLKDVMVGGVGAALGSSLVPSAFATSEIGTPAVGKPKRVIFFMQNNGFHTDTCIPKGMRKSASLSDAKLPESIKPLEPYLDKINIINGLHGRHTTPTHLSLIHI